MALSAGARGCSGVPLLSLGSTQDFVRSVDQAGFRTTLEIQQPSKSVRTAMLYGATAQIAAGGNAVLVGPAGTGKRTLLATAAQMLTAKGRTVAVLSSSALSGMRLGALPLAPFLGLKPNAEVLSTETAAASMARHIRAVAGSFGGVVPCIATVDAIVLHGLELVSPHTLRALDIVARDARKCDEPFGGIQLVASADFWRMERSPSSELVGNLFQMPEWPRLFTDECVFPLTRFFHHDTAADPDTSGRTMRALFGNLTNADIEALSAPTAVTESVAEGSGNTATLLDDRTGRISWAPRFPKQAAVVTAPAKKLVIKQTAFGQYLCGALSSVSSPEGMGLSRRLHFVEGDRVAFAHAMIRDDHPVIPAGTCATVTAVGEHFITVRLTGNRSDETVAVPRMRVYTHHAMLPEIHYSVTQFPLYYTHKLHPYLLINEHHPFPHVPSWHVDARALTCTGDLGNLMARMPTSAGIFSHLAEYLRRDGFVYAPAAVYQERLLVAKDRKAAEAAGIDITQKDERWCRNCKTHVKGEDFSAHWDKCTHEVRWCADCSATVPAAKWEAHCEKHTIVLCLDCGRPLEWRYWEQHRKLCGPMLRELSADNDHLPATTRTTALEASIDRTDLHTVKAISRSMLPRRHTDVDAGHRARSTV